MKPELPRESCPEAFHMKYDVQDMEEIAPKHATWISGFSGSQAVPHLTHTS